MEFFSTTPQKQLAGKREKALKKRILFELNEKAQDIEYELSNASVGKLDKA